MYSSVLSPSFKWLFIVHSELYCFSSLHSVASSSHCSPLHWLMVQSDLHSSKVIRHTLHTGWDMILKKWICTIRSHWDRITESLIVSHSIHLMNRMSAHQLCIGRRGKPVSLLMSSSRTSDYDHVMSGPICSIHISLPWATLAVFVFSRCTADSLGRCWFILPR